MLARLVPGPLVRWFARPYVAGESREAALECAARLLREEGVLSSMDLLGEDVRRPAQVAENRKAYEALLTALRDDPRFSEPMQRPSVSLKPSAFTTGAMEAARETVVSLAETAAACDTALTLDMEDHRWTDFTLDLALSLRAAGRDVGAVLQTRLHRTEEDVERIPAGMRVRLVIGIYREAASIALTNKRRMKERLLRFAGRLLERGAFVEFGTHDEEFLERFVKEVATTAPDRCEIQMLLGVPRERFLRRLKAGEFGCALPVRRYVPFALSWADATAYLRRRMAESPNVVWLVLRNLMPGRSGGAA